MNAITWATLSLWVGAIFVLRPYSYRLHLPSCHFTQNQNFRAWVSPKPFLASFTSDCCPRRGLGVRTDRCVPPGRKCVLRSTLTCHLQNIHVVDFLWQILSSRRPPGHLEASKPPCVATAPRPAFEALCPPWLVLSAWVKNRKVEAAIIYFKTKWF